MLFVENKPRTPGNCLSRSSQVPTETAERTLFNVFIFVFCLHPHQHQQQSNKSKQGMYVPGALVAKFPPSVPCHDGDREIVQEADGREEEQQSTTCNVASYSTQPHPSSWGRRRRLRRGGRRPCGPRRRRLRRRLVAIVRFDRGAPLVDGRG